MLAAIRRWRRRGIVRRHPLPGPPWRRLFSELAMLGALEPEARRRLHDLTVVFLHEKKFFGAHGLELDEYMRIAIAAQACLLILNLGMDYYRGWRALLVFEGAFVARHAYEDDSGVIHEEIGALEGEASLAGPLILSWAEADPAVVGAACEGGPGNVVLHELAHKLDYLTGEANGFPPLHGGVSAPRWSEVFSHAFETFSARLERGEPVTLDSYAAQSPAEFYAVATEQFFMAPRLLEAELPEIYAQLASFYRQDPGRVFEGGFGDGVG